VLHGVIWLVGSLVSYLCQVTVWWASFIKLTVFGFIVIWRTCHTRTKLAVIKL
jgi:hypothetical protein